MSEQIQQREQRETAPVRRKWTVEDGKVFSAALVSGLSVGEILNIAAHGGWGGAAFAAGAAIIIAKSSPDLWEGLKPYMPWADLQNTVSTMVNHRTSEGGRSLVDRAMGRNYGGQETAERDDDDGDIYHSHRSGSTAQDNDECDDDDIAYSAGVSSKKYDFSDVLAGFKPSASRIFLGRRDDGSPIYVSLAQLKHVAIAGKTGNGKGNLMRLLMSQLSSIGTSMLLLNPHYMPYDRSGGEDWTPFVARLKEAPDQFANNYVQIGNRLQWAVNELLAKRIERAAKGQPIGKPYYIVVDEMPAIAAEVKEVAKHMSRLLREGRKFGIYVIMVSQDFQVKTIGLDGGSVRKCFDTVLYVGGDPTTGKELLGNDEVGNPIKILENDLGKGRIMIRCVTVPHAKYAQVPFVDNEAVYRLVGPSTLSTLANDETVSEDEEFHPNYNQPSFAEIYEQLTGARPSDESDTSPLQSERVQVPATPVLPVLPEKGPRAADIDITAAIALWNAGFNSENKLMKAFPGLTKYQAGLLRDRILEQAGAMPAAVE